MENKAKTMQDAKQKAERLRDEAKELLKDAQDKLQRLAGKCVRDTQRTGGSSYNSVLCLNCFMDLEEPVQFGQKSLTPVVEILCFCF